jgi:hypothetical protein
LKEGGLRIINKFGFRRKMGTSITIVEMVERKKNNKRPFNSKRVERGERGDGSPSLEARKLKAQNFEKKERGEKGGGGWIAIANIRRVQSSKL